MAAVGAAALHVAVGGCIDVAVGFGFAVGAAVCTISVRPAVFEGASGVVVTLATVVVAVVAIATISWATASSASVLIVVADLIL